jgi:hypothetical protein
MSGGYPCCCHGPGSGGSSVPQGACDVCLPGTSPPRFRVDINGMHDILALFCDDCESLDGTYLLDRAGNGCYYVVDFPAVCGYNRLELLVAAHGYFATFLGLATGAGALGYHRIPQTAPRDCRVSGLALLPYGFTDRCTHLGSTCLITAEM